MRKSFYFITCLTLFLGANLNAQNFVGNTINNYAGIYGVLENPALLKENKHRIDINLFSFSGFVGNDYVGINFSDWQSFQDGFNFDSDLSRNPSPENKFLGNGNFLGPSILLKITTTSSLAITTRFRSFFNVFNLNGELYDLVSSADISSDFNVDMNQLTGTGHGWAELGGSYARNLISNNQLELDGGITLKYLIGTGGAFGYSDQLQASYTASNKFFTTSGNLEYVYSQGFEEDPFNLSSGGSGFGADIGFSFKILDTNSNAGSYKFRGGISITDLGSVTYRDMSFFTYDLNASIDSDEFRRKDLGEVLRDNYQGTESIATLKFKLPTALRAYIDLPIYSNLYVSAQSAISLQKSGNSPSSTLVNSFIITPRFERKWFGFHSPLSFRQYQDGLSWGIGFRAGPVILGSGSILSNLISSNSFSTDLYLGFKVPLFSE